MVWTNHSKQYTLSSGRPLNLDLWYFSNYKVGDSEYDLLSLHFVNGELSVMEYLHCLNERLGTSFGLQKRDYAFKDGKLTCYKSIATNDLEPLSNKTFEPLLLSALERLIQERPQLENTLRTSLKQIK